MRPKSITQFFRGMFRFLLRQIAAYTFQHFPDEPADDAPRDEKKRAEQAVEVEVFELSKRPSSANGRREG